jgi:HAMP domain-containing protein
VKNYWTTRAQRVKLDLDHIKDQINKAQPNDDVSELKKLKQTLAKELEIAYEALEKFE